MLNTINMQASDRELLLVIEMLVEDTNSTQRCQLPAGTVTWCALTVALVIDRLLPPEMTMEDDSAFIIEVEPPLVMLCGTAKYVPVTSSVEVLAMIMVAETQRKYDVTLANVYD